MSNENDESKALLLQIIKDAVQNDADLREQLQIGDKFRFIRDKLNALQQRVEENLQTLQEATEQRSNSMSEGEVLVYVHLFNAQGLVLQTWQKMVKESVFFDHSVNRPIYGEKEHLEAFLRAKSNKAQHAFLTIAVKSELVLRPVEGITLQDTHGNPLIKVKEGSLKFNKLICFTHQGIDYVVDADGEIMKKDA